MGGSEGRQREGEGADLVLDSLASSIALSKAREPPDWSLAQTGLGVAWEWNMGTEHPHSPHPLPYYRGDLISEGIMYSPRDHTHLPLLRWRQTRVCAPPPSECPVRSAPHDPQDHSAPAADSEGQGVAILA